MASPFEDVAMYFSRLDGSPGCFAPGDDDGRVIWQNFGTPTGGTLPAISPSSNSGAARRWLSFSGLSMIPHQFGRIDASWRGHSAVEPRSRIEGILQNDQDSGRDHGIRPRRNAGAGARSP